MKKIAVLAGILGFAVSVMAAPVLARDSIADGEYHMSMRTGEFQLRIQGNGGQGRGKFRSEEQFGPWRQIRIIEKGRFVQIKGYGYEVSVTRTTITDDSFRGTIRYQNRLNLGNQLFKRQ